MPIPVSVLKEHLAYLEGGIRQKESGEIVGIVHIPLASILEILHELIRLRTIEDRVLAKPKFNRKPK